MYSLFMQPAVASFRHSQTTNADIFESDEEFRIDIAAPGVLKEDFEITATEHTLTVKAEPEYSAPEGFTQRNKGFVRTANIEKVFRFRQPISSADIIAEVISGIISITIPKKTGHVVSITAQ
jgi:HSP20 family protein